MDNNYNNDPNNLGGQNNDPYGQNSGYSNAQQNNQYGQNGYNAPYGQNSGYSNAQQNNQYGQNGYNDPYGQNPYINAPDFYSNVNMGYGSENDGKAVGALVCGILACIFWCLPIAGIPLSIVAITLGNKGKESNKAGMGKAGLIMGCIGLGLSLLNSVAGVFMRL
jgi:hypothetical protein